MSTNRIPKARKQPADADSTLAQERRMLRAIALRPMTAIEQMYAYWGSDRA